MKRKLYFLTILMCIFGGLGLSNLNAQTTVTIGYDSDPDGGLEWCQVDYILYNYSISQMIYTKDELEAVGITSGSEITSIGFMPSYIGSNESYAINRNVEVYVMNTSLTSLTTSTIAVSNPNFVGTVNWGEAGQWSNITFTTPFEYNGENILVCVNDITGQWKEAHKYYAYDVSECRGIYTYNDNNAYTATSANAFTDGTDGYTMTSSNRSDYYIPCISITFESNSGPQPFSLTASAAKSSIYNGETVQLTAKPKGGSGNYTYNWSPAIGLDNASSPTPIFTPTTAGTYTFTCTASDGAETLTADVTVTVEDFSGYCTIEFILTDSYGDGWNGGNLTVVADDGTNETLTLGSGSTTTYTLDIKTGSNVTVTYYAGNYSYENLYTIKYKDGDNIRVDDSGQPTYNPVTNFTTSCGPQILFLTISADKECIPTDGSVQLTAAAQNGTGNYNYSWSPATGLDNASSPTPTFTPSAAGTYTFTCTVNDGKTTATDDVTVTVYEKPNLAKQYRIKVYEGGYAGKYLHINSHTRPNDASTQVGVQNSNESNCQIFTLEEAGNNIYYIRDADGYYIKCDDRAQTSTSNYWSVYAYSETDKTPLSFEYVGVSNFYIRDYDKALGNGNSANNKPESNYFKVQSNNVYCDAPISNTDVVTWTLEEVIVADPTAPSAPTNLRATAVTDSSLNLSWDASANATSYNVYQDGDLKLNVSGTSLQIMGLAAGTEYCFTVTALNEGDEESSPSSEVCVTTAGSEDNTVIGERNGAEPLPIHTRNEYAYSQQIYTSDELEEAGITSACEINAISFYQTTNHSATRNLEIYMLNTDKEEFESTNINLGIYSSNDWENIYDSYKVFDGEYTFAQEGECKITLDTSFLYIPGKNILVCVVDKTAIKDANLLNFQISNTAETQSIATFGASKRKLANLNGLTAPAYSYKNKIGLYYQTISTGVLAIPSAIELAFAQGNYWSEKSIHQKTITIIAKNTQISSISLDDDSFFDILDNNIAIDIENNVNPIVFEVGHKNTTATGQEKANLIITYGGGANTVTVPLSAVTYTPVKPDVYELPREVDLSTGTYTDTPDFTTLHDDYILPGEGTDGNAPDAVYKFTLTEPKEVDVEVLGDKGIYAIYRAEDLPGPSSSNNFVPGASSNVDFFCNFEKGFEGLILIDKDNYDKNWEIDPGEGYDSGEGAGKCAKSTSFDSQAREVENYLVTAEPYYIEENTVLSFWAKTPLEGDADGYKIEVSTNGEDFEVVKEVPAVPTSYKKQEIPLGDKVGQTLYIAINHYTDGMCDLYIDDLMLSRGGSGSGTGSSSVYPAGTYYVVAAAESEFTVRITVKMDNIPTFIAEEGNWNVSGNWNVGRVPNSDEDVIIAGKATIATEDENVIIRSVEIKDDCSLTVGANKSLTVVGLIETDNPNKLVLEDGAQLFQTNDEVLGKFRMKIVAPTDTVEMNPTGWQFISSPMKNAATAGFETAGIGYDLFKYDGDVATEEDLEWINYKGHDDFEAKFQQGRGYMASYAENGIAEFVGEFNNATSFTFDGLKYHGDDIKARIDNFHLLGNPFTFDMDWSKTTSQDLVAGYAVVTTAGGYEYFKDGKIKVGDGFFVKVEDAAPSLTYASNTRGRNKDNNYINLIASGKAGQDNVIINFADNGRDGFDKLENFNKNIAEIYVKENESRYGILNYSEDVEEINIYFNAKQMGYYTINALTNADFANVTLVDRLTGVETDILTDSYTFQAMADDAPDRFILRMNRQVESENFVYRSGEELIINAEGSVQIIDVMGRIVYNSEIVNDNHRVNIGSLKNAAYIVRVVNANEVKTQKVVIW